MSDSVREKERVLIQWGSISILILLVRIYEVKHYDKD